MADEPIDDEAMAAEWEAMAGGGDDDQDAMAAEWEAMAGGDAPPEEDDEEMSGAAPGRVLDQDEIDSLLGFDGDADAGETTGIHALKIGRASCRERVEIAVVGGSLK